MINAILGIKGEMSQAFVEGKRIPVTTVKAGSCVVTQIKGIEQDGYTAVQIGFGAKKISKQTMPLKGHFKKAGVKTEMGPRYLREIKFSSDPEVNLGDILKVTAIF